MKKKQFRKRRKDLFRFENGGELLGNYAGSKDGMAMIAGTVTPLIADSLDGNGISGSNIGGVAGGALGAAATFLGVPPQIGIPIGSAIGSGVGGAIEDVAGQKKARRQVLASKTNNIIDNVYGADYLMAFGGNPMQQVEIEGQETISRPGGEFAEYSGASHAEGGIPYTPATKGEYVFSERLGTAKLSKKINQKYDYAQDDITKNTKKLELNKLEEVNEMLKMNAQVQRGKMAFGGPPEGEEPFDFKTLESQIDDMPYNSRRVQKAGDGVTFKDRSNYLGWPLTVINQPLVGKPDIQMPSQEVYRDVPPTKRELELYKGIESNDYNTIKNQMARSDISMLGTKEEINAVEQLAFDEELKRKDPYQHTLNQMLRSGHDDTPQVRKMAYSRMLSNDIQTRLSLIQDEEERAKMSNQFHNQFIKGTYVPSFSTASVLNNSHSATAPVASQNQSVVNTTSKTPRENINVTPVKNRTFIPKVNPTLPQLDFGQANPTLSQQPGVVNNNPTPQSVMNLYDPLQGPVAQPIVYSGKKGIPQYLDPKNLSYLDPNSTSYKQPNMNYLLGPLGNVGRAKYESINTSLPSRVSKPTEVTAKKQTTTQNGSYQFTPPITQTINIPKGSFATAPQVSTKADPIKQRDFNINSEALKGIDVATALKAAGLIGKGIRAGQKAEIEPLIQNPYAENARQNMRQKLGNKETKAALREQQRASMISTEGSRSASVRNALNANLQTQFNSAISNGLLGIDQANAQMMQQAAQFDNQVGEQNANRRQQNYTNNMQNRSVASNMKDAYLTELTRAGTGINDYQSQKATYQNQLKQAKFNNDLMMEIYKNYGAEYLIKMITEQ